MQDIKRGCEKMLRLRTYKNSDARKIVSWLTEEEAFQNGRQEDYTGLYQRSSFSVLLQPNWRKNAPIW